MAVACAPPGDGASARRRQPVDFGAAGGRGAITAAERTGRTTRGKPTCPSGRGGRAFSLFSSFLFFFLSCSFCDLIIECQTKWITTGGSHGSGEVQVVIADGGWEDRLTAGAGLVLPPGRPDSGCLASLCGLFGCCSCEPNRRGEFIPSLYYGVLL